ncbi:MFS transporter [Ruficoccus sp. ZRK36]|nr:MFS transporter [Ruficoccus sp. ZRK36]QYY37260.1 MFS transporter [Ruficoccus sp. ZRK36]
MILLFGDFSWSMRERSVGPMAQWYLNSLNVPNLVFALILSSFPALIGFFLGPIISYKSDRYRSKWGRRIPFLLVTTPIAAFGMIGIAVTPLIADWLHTHHFSGQSEWVVSVACFSVFWAAFEFATIIGQSVFGGLINDVVPKELLGRFYGFFRAISLIDGMFFNYWIMGEVPSHFTLIMLIIAVFYGTSFLWVCLKVKEGDYPPPSPVTSNQPGICGRFWAGVKEYVRDCYTNPYYLAIFAMIMFSLVAISSVNIFALPYAKSLDIDMDTYGDYLSLAFLISLCLSFFLGWLVDLFHPLRMVIISLTGYMLVTGWGFIFANDQKSFLIAWVLHGVLSGCFYTSAASLGQRLYPHDKYAQFSSAQSTLNSPANILIGPMLGFVIDLSGNAYRYAFLCAALLTIAALICSAYVLKRFIQLGGTKSYEAP